MLGLGRVLGDAFLAQLLTMFRLTLIRWMLLAALPAGLALFTGCGQGASVSAELEASELFELLEEQQMRYDSQAYVEVDLGKFRVTHALSGEEGQLNVQFHLFAV